MSNNMQDAEHRTPFLTAAQNTPAEEPAAKTPTRAERLALTLCPILGYLFWIVGEQEWAIFWSDTGVFAYGYLLFCVLFIAGALAWGCHVRAGGLHTAPSLRLLPAESWLWAGCVLVMGLGITLDRLNAVPADMAWLLWIAFAGYMVLSASGQLTGDATGPAAPLDGLRGIGQGFAGLAAWPVGVWHAAAAPRAKKQGARHIWAILLCVAGALVLLWIAADQLGRADDTFAGWIENMAFWKNWRLSVDYIIYIWFAFPTGAFFYGLTAGGTAALAQKPRPTLAARAHALTKVRVLPAGLGCGILYAFCGLYLLFFVLQGQYLFGGITGRLPEGFTVANYARQGFFELCRVMLLNLGLVAALAALADRPLRGHKGLQIAGTVLLGQSLLLWLTAAAKLALYIGTFGFTAKRLLAAWALLVLAVAGSRAVTALWRRCTVVRPTLLVGAAALALLYLY